MNRTFAFVGILVLLFGAIAYTTYRIWHILPLPQWGKTAVAGLYLLCFLVIFPHYMLGSRMPFSLAAATYEIGNSWMIFFIYALMLFLTLDLGRLVHLVPKDFVINSLAGTCTVFGVIIGLLTYGGFHYHHKYREAIEITTEKQLEKPLTIVPDHQPYHLEDAEAAGADFQFSGHTHHGQVWPGNWLTDAMYEKAFGPHQRGKTRYYISSGLGIWGGKFRIGTRSEYIVLKLRPEGGSVATGPRE